ncbi:MAG: hypothetical protein Q4F99_03440, partial [bacterium]|nr:hypothetical protein [bacterium]
VKSTFLVEGFLREGPVYGLSLAFLVEGFFTRRFGLWIIVRFFGREILRGFFFEAFYRFDVRMQ